MTEELLEGPRAAVVKFWGGRGGEEGEGGEERRGREVV